jgi:hypothetical protein
VLFIGHDFEWLLQFSLPLISNFIPLWLVNIQGIIFIFLLYDLGCNLFSKLFNELLSKMCNILL